MTHLKLVIGNKNYSPWSLITWITLKQAGIEFEEIRILLDLPTTHERIRQYSPTGRVPVLLDGEINIWESLAICEYVTENYAPQLLPEDRTSRAIARSIICEIFFGFHNLRKNMPLDCRARYPGEGMTIEVQADINRITEIWRNCRDRFGKEGDFLFGKFTLADAMFAPVVSRFITYGVKLDSHSQKYVKTMLALPTMQEWLEAAHQETESIDHYPF
ncbi:MAG: glutathione S-transferase family protein [Jaaginema sp. PMC 1079.18]|nr:glutathione S-transferase family protein [Jaaginema sp. PMC 1080.18]MEC4852047.1 glutathione S-transferase family protein [Jaaginema sp. PMC 1079.18]MEC4864647.1 glutathione S-transferase family protein [Jaaginema sp. PMC 1078.18]